MPEVVGRYLPVENPLDVGDPPVIYHIEEIRSRLADSVNHIRRDHPDSMKHRSRPSGLLAA